MFALAKDHCVLYKHACRSIHAFIHSFVHLPNICILLGTRQGAAGAGALAEKEVNSFPHGASMYMRATDAFTWTRTWT